MLPVRGSVGLPPLGSMPPEVLVEVPPEDEEEYFQYWGFSLPDGQRVPTSELNAPSRMPRARARCLLRPSV